MTQATICYPNAFYHICARGENKKMIFKDHSDYDYMFKLLKRSLIKFNIRIHAYCLLPNHYHFYLQTPNANLPTVMKHINESYAKYFIKKYAEQQSGHVFGQRYQRQLVQNENYSNTLFAYIMYNSYRHNKKIQPNQWLYSSYRAISGEIAMPDFLSLDLFKSSFINLDDFHQFTKNFDYSWEPSQEAIAKVFLGDEEFAKDVISKYIDLENENLDAVVKMRNYLGPNQILKYVSQLNLSDKDKTSSIIYLLREYTDLDRQDVSTLLNVSKDVVTQRHRKVRKLIDQNSEWAQILSLEAAARDFIY